MGLIETASNNSVWRGMKYYEEKKVVSWEKTGITTYDGSVSGSDGQVYHVHIDKKHPKKSTCNCAFAEGRRVVCKHMIALYFTAEPQAVEDLFKEAKKWEAEEQEREEQHYEDLKKYVKSLTKQQLQEELLNALVELGDRSRFY